MRIASTELFYETSGAGEPLLLVQGMGATHATWGAPFVSALHAAGLETVAYDHRGIGRSRRWREPFTVTDLADDALALLDALGWPGVHVLGVSLGGMVAQELALKAPERVRTLSLGCTHAGGDAAIPAAQEDFEALVTAMGSGDGDRILRASFALNVSADFAAGEGSYDRFRAMATAAPTPGAVTALQMAAAGRHDADARVTQITSPTLVLHGDRDRMIPVGNAVRLAALIPGSTLEVLPGVGHAFWWEQPEAAAGIVGEHIHDHLRES